MVAIQAAADELVDYVRTMGVRVVAFDAEAFLKPQEVRYLLKYVYVHS